MLFSLFSVLFFATTVLSASISDCYTVVNVSGSPDATLTFKSCSDETPLPGCGPANANSAVKTVTIKNSSKAPFDIENLFVCFPDAESITFESLSSPKFSTSFPTSSKVTSLTINDSSFENLPIENLQLDNLKISTCSEMSGNLVLNKRLTSCIIEYTKLSGSLTEDKLPETTENKLLRVIQNLFTGPIPFETTVPVSFISTNLLGNCFNYPEGLYALSGTTCHCTTHQSEGLCSYRKCYYYKNSCHTDAKGIETYLIVIIAVGAFVVVAIIVVVIGVIIMKKRKANDVRADSYKDTSSKTTSAPKIKDFESGNISAMAEF